MGWAIVSVLGFLAVTALVVWLARSNTARWEARHRAAQATIRAREEVSLRARAAALGSPEPRRRPHLHLPHVHLPPGVVARLPHPHLPHLDGRLTRRLPHLARHRRIEPAPPVEEQETPTVSPS